MSGLWTEHRSPEGRTYWFNTSNKESVWEKPAELKTPFEKALGQTQWKEYFSGGRKYYYNTETKESKWDMPDELLLLLEKVEPEGAADQASAAPRMITPSSSSASTGLIPIQDGLAQNITFGQNANEGIVGSYTGPTPSNPTPQALPIRPNLPDDPVIPHNGFSTVDEGEKAFMHLLRKAGVDANWSWEQTMRAIITDPLFKALNTLAEKKSAFQKYTDGLRAKEQEEKEARMAKLRPAIRNMLKGNPNVFYYTTFATADHLFVQHPIWQQAKIESERKAIFEEYVAELKQREVQESRAIRTRSVSKVVNLFKQLGVGVLTRWRQAHSMLLDSDDWHEDEELRKLPTLDILLAFEDYSRVREREFEEQTRRAQVEKTRKERKAREAFKELLKDLVESKEIKARCKWKVVFPRFKEDSRYLNMLGNPGSNPLESFWDVVDGLDQKFDVKLNAIEDAIRRYNKQVEDSGDDAKQPFVIGPTTTEEELRAVIIPDDHEDLKKLSDEDIKEVYDVMFADAVKKQEYEKKRAERKQRHLQEDLRYAMKKLDEPINVNASYEETVPLIESLPEFKALEDEGRRAAFAKFVKRQKERMREREGSEDGASTNSRKRKEPASRDHRDHERDREKERDRGDREHYRERDKDRDADKEKDYDKEESRRSSKHHRSYDDHERHRDYRDRDRDRGYDRDRDRDRERERERDRDRSRYHKEYDRDRAKDKSHRDREDRDDRKPSGKNKTTDRDTDDHRLSREPSIRAKSTETEERSSKKARYDDGPQPTPTESPSVVTRAETPEEGEI